MSETETTLRYDEDKLFDEDFDLSNPEYKLFGDHVLDLPGSQPSSQTILLTYSDCDLMLSSLPDLVMKQEANEDPVMEQEENEDAVMEKEKNDEDLEEICQEEFGVTSQAIMNIDEIIKSEISLAIASTSKNVQKIRKSDTSAELQSCRANKRKVKQVCRVEEERADEAPKRSRPYIKKVKKHQLDPEKNPECLNAFKAYQSREKKKKDFEAKVQEVANLKGMLSEVEGKNQLLECEVAHLKGEVAHLKAQDVQDKKTINELNNKLKLKKK